MRTSKFSHFVSLADEPPREFLIFREGQNDSTKGPALFDKAAAELVIERYKTEGVDVMIDFNHDAVDEEMLKARRDAADAMGWCSLELRGGELWATNVRWTPEGDERIRSKKQRYISPCFFQDEVTGRVKGIINIALVPMPATHAAQPLIAASKARGRANIAWGGELGRIVTKLCAGRVAPAASSAINKSVRSRAAAKSSNRSKQNANT